MSALLFFKLSAFIVPIDNSLYFVLFLLVWSFHVANIIANTCRSMWSHTVRILGNAKVNIA